MARKRKNEPTGGDLITQLDELIAKGKTAPAIVKVVNIHLGIVEDYIKVSKLRKKRQRELEEMPEREYFRIFEEFYNEQSKRG